MRIGNRQALTVGLGRRPASRAARLGLVLAACLGAVGVGCRKDMYDQPRYEQYEPSTFFPDGTSDRPAVPGTVARGDLRADAHYYTGKVDGKDAETFPFVVDSETIELGRERYQVFCTPCHGRVGDGRGMVVRRGFSAPPSFHSDGIKAKPVGHYYEVISQGYGAMYSYAARIPVKQRWAIAAYIRVLQYSQDAKPDDLTSDERTKLGIADPAPAADPNPSRLAEANRR